MSLNDRIRKAACGTAPRAKVSFGPTSAVVVRNFLETACHDAGSRLRGQNLRR